MIETLISIKTYVKVLIMLEQIITIIFAISNTANAFLYLPQILLLYKRKDSSGVSLLMFFCFCMVLLVTTLYGYTKQDYILATTSLLSLCACGTATTLIIIYRLKAKKQ